MTTGAPELDDLAQRFADAPGEFFPDSGDEASPPDGALQAIVKLQGFDGLPEVVTEEQLQARFPQWDEKGFKINQGDGSIELWRGLSDDINGTGDHYAEQFRTGAYHTGDGLYGNGTYTSTDRNLAAAYTYDSQGLTNPNPRGLLHMALRPDARIVDYDIEDETGAFHQEWTAASRNSRGEVTEPLYLDAGRYAAAKGYDAMRLPGGNYVILNRTAVVVAR